MLADTDIIANTSYDIVRLSGKFYTVVFLMFKINQALYELDMILLLLIQTRFQSNARDFCSGKLFRRERCGNVFISEKN